MARFVGDLEPDLEARCWKLWVVVPACTLTVSIFCSLQGTITISTLAGLIKPELLPDGNVIVDMGEPFLQVSLLCRPYPRATLASPLLLLESLACGLTLRLLQAAEVPTTLPADSDGRVINVPLEVRDNFDNTCPTVALTRFLRLRQVAGKEWLMTCVGMGNPHAITFVDDLDDLDLASVGPLFEKHPVFPAKTNTEFVQVMKHAGWVRHVHCYSPWIV